MKPEALQHLRGAAGLLARVDRKVQHTLAPHRLLAMQETLHISDWQRVVRETESRASSRCHREVQGSMPGEDLQ